MEKKRVLYFIPEFPKLSETFIEREVSKLIELDNLNIQVLSLAKASGTTSESVRNRTIYKRLRVLDVVKGLLYVFTKTKKVREAWGLTSPKGYYFFIKALGYTNVISSLKPRHIHVHFFSWPSTTTLIASLILDLPFSVSGHAKDVFVEGEFIKQKVEKAIFVTICNSFAYQKAREIAGADLDASKIKLIYHGIDPKMFEEPATKPKWEVPAIFLGGTRLVEKKGLRYMIEASKILIDKGIAHRVDLVGPGELYKELQQMIENLGLQQVVFIHGEGKGTPFKEVLEYYKRANIFVLPSIETGSGDADGIPNVCVEAAMARLPIISTDAGGITDLVENGGSGIIVEQRNPKAIAEAIQKLMADGSLANKLSQNAYIKAVEMFDINKNVGKLESLLI